MKVAELVESLLALRQRSCGTEIIENPVFDRSDQRGRRPTLRLADRLDRWTTTADDHLHQDSSVVLTRKCIVRHLVEQRAEEIYEDQPRAEQLFDQLPRGISAVCPSGVIHMAISLGAGEFAPLMTPRWTDGCPTQSRGEGSRVATFGLCNPWI